MDMQSRYNRDPAAHPVAAMSWKTTLAICLALLVVVGVPGCRGCLNTDPVVDREEQQKKKKKEKPKPDFEIGRLRATPRDETSSINFVKPGHWISASQAMRANNYDFKADIESATTDRNGVPLDIENTPYRMTMSRPAGLPKGQLMQFETMFFVPGRPESSEDDLAMGQSGNQTVWLKNSLHARQGGREMKKDSEPTSVMPDYQYYFVVLSNDPDRYGYLKNTDSVHPPMLEPRTSLETILQYRVILPKIKGRVPLPSQPLVWTTIAYVLWDGMNPDALSLDQQQAMLDWLHWGGQLIVSGPNSLATLRGSFLDAYLPATGEEAVSLPLERFASLQETWSIPHLRTGKTDALPILPDKPLVGVQLTPHDKAHALPACENLVLERRIGAGRIVVTAFSPADRALTNWTSFDGFLNACLLRRPGRKFSWSPEQGSIVVDWVGDAGTEKQMDARYMTGLRYFARDVTEATEAPPPTWMGHSSQKSVAAWNNFSGTANRARRSLRDAAGISIPRAGFVFRVLVVYLIVLVPVNWAVFRILRRVEWAWIAAPLIAISGAVAVVRLAQLDIGFARSRTEIAVLELQGGYDRGHLTRYTALYSSLSTGYELRFENDSAQAMPFPHLDESYRRGIHESVKTVRLRRDREITLSGFQVASNSTELVQSQVMQDVGGRIDLTGDQMTGWIVRNTTDLNLRDVGVLHKLDQDRLEVAWIGALESAQSAAVVFQSAPLQDSFFSHWAASPTCCSYARQRDDIFARAVANDDKLLTRDELANEPDVLADFDLIDIDRDNRLAEAELHAWCMRSRDGELTLGPLFELASSPSLMRNGEIRLVGWTEQDLPGLEIEPAASQQGTRLLVLAHLRRGPLPKAQRDANLRVDIQRATTAPYEEPAP